MVNVLDLPADEEHHRLNNPWDLDQVNYMARPFQIVKFLLTVDLQQSEMSCVGVQLVAGALPDSLGQLSLPFLWSR